MDNCNSAPVTNPTEGLVSDWSACRVTGVVPGGDVLLNVASFLQLGGRWHEDASPTYPVGLDRSGFEGCIKDFMHDTIVSS